MSTTLATNREKPLGASSVPSVKGVESVRERSLSF